MIKKNDLVRKGKIGELKAQVILLDKGYNVYSSICDDSGVDLVAEKGGKFWKIQVKTAFSYDEKRHRVSYGLGNTNNKPDYFLCIFKDKTWLIPRGIIISKAFCIHPGGMRCKFNKYRIV